MQNKSNSPKKPFYKRKWVLITGGIIVFLFIIGALSDNKSTAPNTDNSTEDKSAVADNTPPAPKPVVPIQINTAALIAEFDKNQLAAEEKYQDKLIKFTAFIDNISEDILGKPFLSLQPIRDDMYFGTSLQCIFKNKSDLTSLANGQSVTLQGTVKSQTIGIIVIENCQIVSGN